MDEEVRAFVVAIIGDEEAGGDGGGGEGVLGVEGFEELGGLKCRLSDYQNRIRAGKKPWSLGRRTCPGPGSKEMSKWLARKFERNLTL